MIFVSAQPDELLFAWQTEVQLLNFTKLGIDLKKVYILVGVQGDHKPDTKFERWERIKTKYPEANLVFIKDSRVSKIYAPSIRPFLLGQFFQLNQDLQDEYMFYYDSDIVLTEVPAFDAMEDGRWHISKADYISWNYIDEKKSPTLMKDMLSSVGIDEETVKSKGQEVGGVQYFIYGTTPEFWQKVEQDCERMWQTYHSHFEIYREEFYNNKLALDSLLGKYGNRDFPSLSDWRENKTDLEKWDFQIWCTDMWCIYWNALLFGTDIYVNPELNFGWPKHAINTLEDDKIYHDTSIEESESNQWFWKGGYRIKTPFRDDLSKLGYVSEGVPAAQRFYIDLIEEIQKSEKYSDIINPVSSPVVSCIMTTYGRFECVERSIACWLNQDYLNKELVILNTAEKPLVLGAELQNKGIRIVNSQFISGTNDKYTNVGQIRADAIKLAHGEYYICWDDDDFYMPFHISNGIKYILKTGKKAWMPNRSYWSPDGGTKLEYAKNSMEAACIVKLDEIKKYGFINSNGGEHLSWRRGLVEVGELDENTIIYPFESYLYLWGEEIASHKQSGSIGSPTCFEDHKKASTDFGFRPLSLYSPLRMKWWYKKLVDWVNSQGYSEELINAMQNYI